MNINKEWLDIIKSNDYIYDKLTSVYNYTEKLRNSEVIYPSTENVFRALNLTSFNDVKVVILGQDPYHGENEANGLAFSINEGVRITPSLRNIFKELKSDLNIDASTTDLTKWAKQGVLLLNTILTVVKDQPLSLKGIGWEEVTDYLIKYISDNKENVVFILWGNNARSKVSLINKEKHLVIESAHPSPLSSSRGFFNSKPFSKTNDYLKKNNQSVIDWSL